jgi:hypothetical protein
MCFCIDHNLNRKVVETVTKKDYIKFAIIFKETHQKYQGDAVTRYSTWLWTKLMNGVADIFQADDPRFDRARFIAACNAPIAEDK